MQVQMLSGNPHYERRVDEETRPQVSNPKQVSWRRREVKTFFATWMTCFQWRFGHFNSDLLGVESLRAVEAPLTGQGHAVPKRVVRVQHLHFHAMRRHMPAACEHDVQFKLRPFQTFHLVIALLDGAKRRQQWRRRLGRSQVTDTRTFSPWYDGTSTFSYGRPHSQLPSWR